MYENVGAMEGKEDRALYAVVSWWYDCWTVNCEGIHLPFNLRERYFMVAEREYEEERSAGHILYLSLSLRRGVQGDMID